MLSEFPFAFRRGPNSTGLKFSVALIVILGLAHAARAQDHSRSLGEKTVLVQPIDFPDETGDPIPPGEGPKLMMKVSDFYRKSSRGKTSLTAKFLPVGRMPHPMSYYMSFAQGLYSDAARLDAVKARQRVEGELFKDEVAIAKANGEDPARFQYALYVTAAKELLGGGHGGGHDLHVNNAWSFGTIAHEMGHCYGLRHACGWNATDGSPAGEGYNVEYADPFDVMGSGGDEEDEFGIAEKYRLGWLSDSQIPIVTTSGSYAIQQSDSTASNGAQGLRILRGGRIYWVEFRHSILDNQSAQKGICIEWSHDSTFYENTCLIRSNTGNYPFQSGEPSGRDFRDSAFVLGRTFADQNAGIFVTPTTVSEGDPATIHIQVHLGKPQDEQTPKLSVNASSSTVAPNSPIQFKANVSRPNNTNSAYYWDFGDGTFGPNDAIATKSWANPGEFVVRCTVSNMRGSTACEALLVKVGNPDAMTIRGRISDQSGPLQDVTVCVDSGSHRYSGVSNSDGVYIIAGLPTHFFSAVKALTNYTISAVKADYTISPVGVANPFQISKASNEINMTGVNNRRSTTTVTTTRDLGPGSFREAMTYAQTHPGHRIVFNIPRDDPGFSNGVYRLQSDINKAMGIARGLDATKSSRLPDLDADGTVIDATTQPGYANVPIIEIDGSKQNGGEGLRILASKCRVMGLAIDHCDGVAVHIVGKSAFGNTVEDCYLGSGTKLGDGFANSSDGVAIDSGAHDNQIGRIGHGNVISGNGGCGVRIVGPDATKNSIVGNIIGTDAAGTVALPNRAEGIILHSGASGNQIGGATKGSGNLVSGNGYGGIVIEDAGTKRNVVQGNWTGLDSSGTAAIPNGHEGIVICRGASDNTIGGNIQGSGNLSSGNRGAGIALHSTGTTGNTVIGNLTGVNLDGTAAVPNGHEGIVVYAGASDNVIGGLAEGCANLASGNRGFGIALHDVGTMRNAVVGNRIGLGLSGTRAIPNGQAGVGVFSGASNNNVTGNIER